MKKYAFVVAVCLAIGCGGGSTTPDAGGIDPVLVGNWEATITTGPENQTAGFTFNANGGYGYSHGQTNDAASADHPGCRQNDIDSGIYTVVSTTNGMGTFTITPTASSSTRTYSVCTNPSDNGPGTGSVSLPMTTYTYSIQGGVLTITSSSGSIMFMRGT